MKKYVLGVDGGGTKTDCALFDISGNLIDLVHWGTTNHERMSNGLTELQNELDKMIVSVLTKNKVLYEELGTCVFGLAGVDTSSQHAVISDIIAKIGISDHILCNDAVLGIKAGAESGHGICLINGTGCTAIGLDSSGRTCQIGGYGQLTGDAGGGSYLGMAALTGVYNCLFKDLSPTIMADILFKMLHISSKEEYMNALTHALSTGVLNIAELNRVVFQAANEGDVPALSILETMGSENSRAVYGIINTLSFDISETIELILAGSIYVRGENPSAVHKLQECVQKTNPNRKIHLQILPEPPVAGAICWALEATNGSNDLFPKVKKEFTI